jgi:hypothetical protein
MINLDSRQVLEGLEVFRDDSQWNLYYVIPDQPRLRIDEVTKKPIFTLIKYKMPVDRPDGKKGGGFVIFDSTFTVPDDKLKKIQAKLDTQLQASGFRGGDGQPAKAQIGKVPFTKGTASLILLDSGGALVTKIQSPGKPSLFGSLICSFTAELSPEGATVLEAVLKGGRGVAQVSYDMHFPATLPPITGRVWFYASKFYSFYQSVDKSGGSWDSSNNREVDHLHESFMNSQAGGVYFDFSHLGYLDADTSKKIHDAIENWGWSQIDQAVKTAILPDIKAAEDRGDHGMDHIKKMQSTWESSSFNRYISEKEGVDFESPFVGTLPSVTEMGFKWQDFYVEVDANDPFFAQVHSSIAVNADFERYGIDSVDVHCEYTKGNPATIKDFHFKKADDIGKFDSNTSNGDMHYAYSFCVNYKDQSKPYQSELIETNKGQVTINANELGILYVGISIGSVDFDKTPQVQVAVRYPEDDANGHPVSQQFNFTKDKKADRMLAVLLKPVDKEYEYQITYIMADGTQVVTEWRKNDSNQLYINSPFVMHTFSFLAEGDFANSIDNIFLKMKYADPINRIEQEADYTFTVQNRSKDWQIPVISGGKGTVTYSGVISYKNHTTEPIPPIDTERDLIEFGPPNQVIISVMPDTTLIDFSAVKMIKLDLEYKDDDNKIDMKREYLLKNGVTPQPWTFYARNPQKTSYSYATTFYLATTPPKVVQVPPASSTDTELVLTMPA